MRIVLCFSILMIAGVPCYAGSLVFERERIGDSTFEAASVFDVNNDGKLDIVSGGFWYEGPDFQKRHKICDVARVGDYYDDFSDYPMDVDGDGYLDIVTGGYWGLKLRWVQNPGSSGGAWNVHEVAEVGPIERNTFYDIDGDGVVEVFCTTSPVHFFRLVRDENGRGTGKFEQYTITTGGGGHGFGCGDINGDKRPDLVFSQGWLEAPENPYEVEKWQWHAEWNLGVASVPILVYDVNKDGANDLIVGQAHDYGLAWYEQQRQSSGERIWIKHSIDDTWSQVHDLQLHDIDNDGELELVTGKRYRAHNEHDPGSFDPLGVYYYEMGTGDFKRVTIDYGPAGRASGVGIYFWVCDLDHNGWKDIVAPGKEGLYLFRNQGFLPN